MTLQSLITRVEAGSGSDRQLDADICVALQWGGMGAVGAVNYDITRNDGDIIYVSKDDCSFPFITPKLTSSLDAIRALFKERLEGWIVRIDDHTRARAVCQVLGDDKMFFTKHPDVHRAFLSAVLKAIAAKEG